MNPTVSNIPKRPAEISADYFTAAFKAAAANPPDINGFGMNVYRGVNVLIDVEVLAARREMQAEIDCRQKEIERLNQKLAERPQSLF